MSEQPLAGKSSAELACPAGSGMRKADSDLPDLKLEMVSNPAYLCGARELINQIAKRVGFSDSQACQIALAVDEALINVMRHGYEKRPDGRIWVSVQPLSGDPSEGLRVVVEDEAKQVDPATIRGRSLDDIRPGGLGVHIIREVMDEVVYEKRGEVGMRLILTKRLQGKDAAGAPGQLGCGQCEGNVENG
jgi:serine/threonine-protein kinase RsbW